MTDAPVHRLDLRTCLQVDDTVTEEVEDLLTYLLGIVPVLEYIAWREVVPYLIEVFHQLVGVLVGLKLLGHLWQRGCLQYIDDEYGVVGSQRATALRDDIGVGQLVLVGGIHKGIDTVVDILLDGVVHRTLTRWRTCSVIVDTQSTSTVHEVYVIAHLVQLDIEL